MSFDVQAGARLSEERDRIGLSQQGLSDASGVARNMLSRYERAVAEPGASALIALAAVGLDVGYVLTGRRSPISPQLSAAQREALAARGIQCGVGERQNEIVINPVGLVWVLNYSDALGEPLVWSIESLAKLAVYQPDSLRDLNLQVVKLVPEPGKAYSQLLFYLRKTPPYTPWSISPSEGLKTRFELDALSTTLPIVFPDSGDYLTPVLVIPDEMRDVLDQGHVVRVSDASVLVESPLLAPVQSGRQTSIVVHGDVGQQVSGNAVISGSQTFHVGSAMKRR